MQKKLISVLLVLGSYLISAGISYAVFTFVAPSKSSVLETPAPSSNTINNGKGGKFKPLLTGPADQICPINGAEYTKTEKDLWDTRRPLLVMIENHEESRPQSGLSKADVVYEAVAEGAITRFMAVFYCGNAAYAQKGDYDIGPVRSARTYYLDWASEYGDYPLYTHVGGAGNCSDETVDPRAKALCQIEKYGWLNAGTKSDLNQFALSYKVCRREPDRVGKEVAYEHQMYCSAESLWQTAADRGLTNVTTAKKDALWSKTFRSWQFKDDSPSSGSVSPEFEFWTDYKAYKVKWDYDKTTNSYKRSNGGTPHIDFNTQEQLTAKNIVIQFAVEKGPLDEHKHIWYGTVDSGKALVFLDGKVIEGKWSKKSRTDRTLFFDNTGKEIKFNRGSIWIEVLPLTGKVNY